MGGPVDFLSTLCLHFVELSIMSYVRDVCIGDFLLEGEQGECAHIRCHPHVLCCPILVCDGFPVHVFRMRRSSWKCITCGGSIIVVYDSDNDKHVLYAACFFVSYATSFLEMYSVGLLYYVVGGPVWGDGHDCV